MIEPYLEAPSCNAAYAQLAYRIIELPTHYERLVKFMRELEYKEGILSQGLCDGLKEMVYQFYHLVIQLDDKQAQAGLSLQNMWV